MDSIRSDNFCTTSGLLTATGGETVYDTTVTICFCVDGKAKTKTAVTDGATPTLDYNTGAAFLPITGVSGVSGQGTVVVFGYLEGGADG